MSEKHYEWVENAAFMFPTPQALWDDYYYALGKFLHTYANFEANLGANLKWLVESNLNTQIDFKSQKIISVIFGTMTLEQIKRTLKILFRILNAKSIENKELIRLLSQINSIQTVRNRIVHNGVRPDTSCTEGWFECHNLGQVTELKNADVLAFKVETLENMTSDLERMDMLFFHLMGFTRIVKPDVIFPDIPSYLADYYRPWAFEEHQLKKEKLPFET